MTLVVAAAAGFLAGRLAWVLLRPTFAASVFERVNYRGRPVPTAAGVVLPVALLAVEAGRAVAGAAGVGDDGAVTVPRAVTLLAVIGFALLGAVDDLTSGAGDVRGFRGHVASLFRARLTTGGLKLVGGAAVALVVCGPMAGSSVSGLLRDAALVALSANLGNLLDRAPGRVLKVSALAFVALAALAAVRTPLVGPAVVVGAGLAVLRDDLHERLMLGDTGANVLGGVLGLGLVLVAAPSTRTIALVVVAALNLLSELVSFSRVIDAVPPLRLLDRAGRRSPG